MLDLRELAHQAESARVEAELAGIRPSGLVQRPVGDHVRVVFPEGQAIIDFHEGAAPRLGKRRRVT